MRCDMKAITAFLFVMFMCAGCREEATSVRQEQTNSSATRKSDERVLEIEQEISKMPQKLAGKGWNTMFWGSDLAKGIMGLRDLNERIRLMNRYLDWMVQIQPSLIVPQNISQAFRNYELLIDASTIFEDGPEIAERILGIMCDCIQLHRQEIEKWADAIEREPNRRDRVPLKNVHGCLASDFMMFTNHVERTYFPWMKSHGLPPDRHEIWRQRINDAEGR